jgi:putative NADH-flavin reductase
MTQQVTVFGANGRVGRRVVAEALRRGYTVVAFIHSGSQFATNDLLRVVQGDIYNADDVNRALDGSAAVVSALGSWGAPRKDILTAGMMNIIPAMQHRGIQTVVSLTGADARAPGDKIGIVHRVVHVVLMVAAQKVLVDGEHHIALLDHSGLDWTVLRSPVMRPKADTAHHYAFNKNRPMPWRLISYDTVAVAMVNALEDRTWSKTAPYITKR